MKSFFIGFLKGILIGAGTLIPGVSGGTTAIVLGVFEDILDSIANITKHFKSSIIFLLPIGLGGVLGILIFSPTITLFCESVPIVSKYVFCALSFVSLLFFINKSIKPNITLHKSIWAAFGMVSASLISVIITVLKTDLNTNAFTILFIISIPLALALILPAISFSYMLYFFGIYEKTLVAITEFDISFLLPLLLGLILGSIIFAKLLLRSIEKHREKTYSYVLGFVLFSLADIIAG